MKIIIQLSDAEVKGIKRYLRAGDEPENKQGITDYIANIVSGNLHNPIEAVSDFVNEEEEKLKTLI